MQKPKDPIVCRCNEVPRSVIEQAMKNGAQTLNEIFDHTSAGVGACGGSCRRCLKPMLDEFLKRANPTTLQSHPDDKKKSS